MRTAHTFLGIKKTISYSLLFSIGVDLFCSFWQVFVNCWIFFRGWVIAILFFWIFETGFLCNPDCPGTCSKTRFSSLHSTECNLHLNDDNLKSNINAQPSVRALPLPCSRIQESYWNSVLPRFVFNSVCFWLLGIPLCLFPSSFYSVSDVCCNV